MRYTTRLLALTIVLSVMGITAAQAELAVIAHPGTSAAGVAPDELARIYLGKTGTLGGERVTPVDQAEGTPARMKFYRQVVGMDARELKSYWSKLMFTGKGKPPQSLANGRAVREWVAAHPGSLGYVEGSHVDGSVKVLLILP